MAGSLFAKFNSVAVATFLTLGVFSPAHADKKLYLESGLTNIQQLKDMSLDNKLNLAARSKLNSNGNSFEETKSSYSVIQFERALSFAEQSLLSKQGIEILRYIPDDAFVVRTSKQVLDQLSALGLGNVSVVPFAPQIKLSSQFNRLNVFNVNGVQQIDVRVFRGEDIDLITQKLERLGARVLSYGRTGVTVEAANGLIQKIAQIDGVEWVAKKNKFQLHVFAPETEESQQTSEDQFVGDYSDLTGLESGVKTMNFDKAWEKDITGDGQIVGIADTGLDTGVKKTLSADFSNLYKGFALGIETNTWADFVGHGTHVAGSVAGQGAHSNKLITGGAIGAQILMQSLWSVPYETVTLPDDIQDIFKQAYNSGARIHSNSWGLAFTNGLYTTQASQVDEFVWNNPDMLVLFAAGNDGVDDDKNGRVDSNSISSPATAKNVLAVGASENLVSKGGIQDKLGEMKVGSDSSRWPTEPLASDTFSNNINGVAAFSSRGPTRDGRLKPDVVAPGTNILSNCSQQEGSYDLWGKYNKHYCFSGGTSMSTPLVAAAAALVRERLQKTERLNKPSAALIKAILMHTAVDMYPGQFGEVGSEKGQELLKPGPNINQGYGRVDVARATLNKLVLIDSKSGVKAGEDRFYDIDFPIKKVTLVYTDAPAAPFAGRTLVNNLDLELHTNSDVYKSESRVNNSEQINLDGLTTGATRIFVKGISVPMGKRDGSQPFALVVSAEN